MSLIIFLSVLSFQFVNEKKQVSRAPSSVDVIEGVNEVNGFDSSDIADSMESSALSINARVRPVYAALPLRQRQNFVSSVFNLIDSQTFYLSEAGQPLGRVFQRAVAGRNQINHCHKFIQEDGTYGEIGQMIERVLTQYPELEDELMVDAAGSKAGMQTVCPRFTRLTPDQRKEFWVWVMASLALFESTCGFDTTNPANSNAVGMYQLHASTTDREARALVNSSICGRLTRAQIADDKNNTFCALDFIRDSFSGRMTHAPAGLITRAQQFERLRDPDNYIVTVLRQLRICQPNANDNS